MNSSATPPTTRAPGTADALGERTLSSPRTALLKFAVPIAWLAIGGYAVWRLWTRPDAVLDVDPGSTTDALRWLFLVLFAVGLMLAFAFVAPLKRVRLGRDGLRISNFRREITLPFAAIARVRQSWLPTFRVVTMDLRHESEFGRRIIFRPAGPRRMAFWKADYGREDDLVGELKRLAGLR